MLIDQSIIYCCKGTYGALDKGSHAREALGRLDVLPHVINRVDWRSM